MTTKKVRIGTIVGCHGIRGELKVRPASEDSGWAESLKAVLLKKKGDATEKHLNISAMRRHGPHVLLTFEGFADRTLAEPLLGSELFADVADLPEPEEDEFWADDLIGLDVVDAETGRKRGIVKDLLSSSGSEFLEIKLEESRETVVIPFIHRFFPDIDLEAKTITIDLLNEFLSLASEPVTPDRLEQ
ncbi:MAG TPA: ribosome maturation factor RimM [Coleofasciculaceae cyanobacterium]|jgi:16S rRNA processing protein RimM